MRLSEVILRSDLTGGMSRESRLAVGDKLQRGAGTVKELRFLEGALAVLTDVDDWLVTPVGWCRIMPPKPEPEPEKPTRKR